MDLEARLENLLQWSRYQTGRIEYSPIFYYLKDQVEDVLEIFSTTALRKQISIESLVNKNDRLFADKDMIETVRKLGPIQVTKAAH